ncbi:MAG: hypothetical protein J0H37_06660, partial [Hyphomicrobium denitrificans]|nr:hypothetical protein [Hyphomicrobium denitrificans]
MQQEADLIISLPLIMALIVAIAMAFYLFKFVASSGTVVSEGLRGVVYRDGKFDREVGPGRHWISPRSTLRTVNVNETAIT